ncbi:hypothetical protein EGW08_010267, partial [Elysia chlorotica]
IKEITGALRIIRSHVLLTLHFFQSLEKIGSTSQALVVMDNKNLEELFVEQQLQKMKINGNVSFVGNRRLCLEKIDHFINTTGVPRQEDDLYKSNGHALPCNMVEIVLFVSAVTSDSVELQFKYHNPSDARNILHYSVHYKEVTQNVRDIYEGRDACSKNSWKTQKFDHDEDKDYSGKPLTFLVINLQPYTLYAFYVQPVVTETAMTSALSNITYVLTDIGVPSYPEALETIDTTPHEAKLMWEPPQNPNSVVTFYTIWLKKDEKTQNKNFYGRDLCSDSELQKLLWDTDRRKQVQDAERRRKEAEKYRRQNCCDCPKSEVTLELLSLNRMSDIEFENSIHDSVFRKRWSEKSLEKKEDCKNIIMEASLKVQVGNRRKRRSVDSIVYNNGRGSNFSFPIRKEDITKDQHYLDTNFTATDDLFDKIARLNSTYPEL